MAHQYPENRSKQALHDLSPNHLPVSPLSGLGSMPLLPGVLPYDLLTAQHGLAAPPRDFLVLSIRLLACSPSGQGLCLIHPTYSLTHHEHVGAQKMFV